jgi:2-polyprenyl-3-methyl-5-hydroxy-6-metoxy-1,4-benzoquinol methylase
METMVQATQFHRGFHCDASDIFPAVDACPICLSADAREAIFEIQRSPLIVMLECKRCRGCSASHMPTDHVLAKYYSEYYANSQLRTTTSNEEYFARHVVAPMSRLAGLDTIRILDYGSGDGTLARAVALRMIGKASGNCRVQIDLVDYEKPGDFSDRQITVRGHKDLNDIEGDYDLILASAVLEHVPQVNGVIRQLTSLARPGAYLYARTPFMIPLARLVRKFDLTYPAHVHDMGSSFWNRFVQTFSLRADLIASRPSLIETAFFEAPTRTMAAFIMKLPSHLELALRRPRPIDPIWTLVGGWEVVLRFHA